MTFGTYWIRSKHTCQEDRIYGVILRFRGAPIANVVLRNQRKTGKKIHPRIRTSARLDEGSLEILLYTTSRHQQLP